MKIQAQHILGMLAHRHSKDVFVPECKTGPSVGGGYGRLDAWAMKKSWSKPWSYGYEIKVSRSDFLRDDKWQHYLAYCNYFSFVIAPDVCSPSELPDGVGLLSATKNGAIVRTIRKPVRRDGVLPEEIYRYILMARVNVTREYDPGDTRERNVAYWRNWLKQKQENQQLGYAVSRRIRLLVEDGRRQHKAGTRLKEKYEPVIKMLEDAGLNSSWALQEHIQDTIDRKMPERFKRELRRAHGSLGGLLKEIDT